MIHETAFATADGLTLYGWTRQPPGPVNGVIAHVHGMGEHSRRYDHLTAYWESCGYASAGFDQRGHGRSTGQRGHTASYELLMDDIALFLDRVSAAFPALPITLYGHSMGGNLVLNYVIRRRPALARVVASAPYLRLAAAPPPWKVQMAGALSHIVPALSQRTGIASRALSRDPAVVERYDADPLVHDRITVTFFSQVHAAGEAIIPRASELMVPALVMHGSADTITSQAGSEAFVAASAGRARLKIWDGSFHEIHNEPGWQAVAVFVLTWIDAHVQSMASTPVQ